MLRDRPKKTSASGPTYSGSALVFNATERLTDSTSSFAPVTLVSTLVEVFADTSISVSVV